MTRIFKPKELLCCFYCFKIIVDKDRRNMKYNNIKGYPCDKFRRICGMKKQTFEKAIEILNAKYAEEHSENVRKSGRKPKPCMEDKLLATLEYLREYRTMAHIAASYGIAESNTQTRKRDIP